MGNTACAIAVAFVPVYLVVFVAGMLFARFIIVRNPGQVGLRRA